jgi:hypothetical protein
MTAKQSPFYAINYGWAYGEDNWNTGMDDSLVKLGFFARRVVDAFVTVLPSSPVAGYSCILPNNSINFYVDKWFTVAPVVGEIYKIGVDQYEFTGSAFTLKVQAESVQTSLTPRISKLEAVDGIQDLGTVTTNTTINVTDKRHVKLAVGGNVVFTFNDTPVAGTVFPWTLELEMLGQYTVTFPSGVWEGGKAPSLGDSGKKIINFINSGGTRFGWVEVGNVLVESSQGLFIGGAVVVPSTNPTASSGGTLPPDTITTDGGQVFLKEGKIAAVSGATPIAKIRQWAPWLEVGVYDKTYSNITFTSGVNAITAKLIDFLWDDVSSQWVCLTFDVSGTGSTLDLARILTSPDLITFTPTTGLNANNLTDTLWTHLIKFTDGDGVVKFMLTKRADSTGQGMATAMSGYISTTLSNAGWISRTVINGMAGTYSNLNSQVVSRYGQKWLSAENTGPGQYFLKRFSASNVLENVLAASAASPIIAADYDGGSKYYYATSAGAVLDQTNSNIGISFIGSNNATTGSEAIAPLLRYVPELSGWLAIEQRLFGSRSTSTVVPRVFFRPDTTQVWGQISTFPTSVKYPSSSLNVVERSIEILYHNNTIIIPGLIDINATAVPLFWTHAATSTDGGVTWQVVKVSDLLLPLVARSTAYGITSSKKRHKTGEYFKIVNSVVNAVNTSEYILSLGSSDIFVETNQSAASPTVTSTYTRII